MVEAEGYDPEEMDQRIAHDKEREERLGLNFPPSSKAQGESEEVETDEDEEDDEADTIPDNVRRLLP